jgi:hypothetical protein
VGRDPPHTRAATSAVLEDSALVSTASADSIDDLALPWHGGMGGVFDWPYPPSALGSFLRRGFAFGHVRQFEAVADRSLARPAARTRLLRDRCRAGAGRRRRHDHRGARLRQAGRRVRLLPRAGLSLLLAKATTQTSAPVLVASRLRKGSAGSPGGARVSGGLCKRFGGSEHRRWMF